MKKIVSFAVAVLAGISVAAPARADDEPSPEVLAYASEARGAVCATLAEYPSPSGAMGILAAIVEDGFTPREAGEIVALSVMDSCPQFIPVLQRFVAIYGGRGAAA